MQFTCQKDLFDELLINNYDKNMKIEDNKSTKIEKVKTKASKNLDSFSFSSLFAEVSDDTSEVSDVSLTSSIDATNLIFATQSTEDASERRARNLRVLKKGEDLLDRLEDIRTSIIAGAISKEDIISLGQSLRSKRETDIDPKLEEIMNDIELRVEVELAKISMLSK